MALALGHQVTATDTSITFAIDQGTLPGNFASDRFYALTEYPASEPATADVTLTAGGNASVTISGLQPDRNYWIVGWRHFNDATPPAQGTGPDAAYTTYLQSDYQTWADSALYTPPTSTTWVEDWTQGFNRWIDEYPVFSERGVRTYPDDGAIGSRYYKSTQAPGDPHVLHSGQKWDWNQPLDVTAKVRMANASIWQGGFGVATGEYGYFTLSKWGQITSLAATVSNNAQAAYLAQTPIAAVPPVGTVQTWRITFDGDQTWKGYVDGVLQITFTWKPKAPLSLWCGLYNGMDIGAISVTGTPFTYGSSCGMDLFARWSGSFSCREERELERWGNFAQDFGGLTAPNTAAKKKSSVGSEGQADATYAAGSWSARSPKLRNVKRLRYSGRQANGSMTLAVKRVADDSTIATLTPAGSAADFYNVPFANQGEDLYVVVSGNVTASSTDASVLHYLAAEPVAITPSVGRSWVLPYAVQGTVGRSWALPYTIADNSPKTWPTLRRLQPGIVTATWPTRRRLRDPSQLQPAAVDSPTLVADPLADRVLIGVSE